MEGKLHLIDPDGDVLLVVDDCSDDDETETKGMPLISYVDNGRDDIFYPMFYTSHDAGLFL